MSDCMNRRCPNAAEIERLTAQAERYKRTIVIAYDRCVKAEVRVEELEGVIYYNCDPMAASYDDAKIIEEIAATRQEEK